MFDLSFGVCWSYVHVIVSVKTVYLDQSIIVVLLIFTIKILAVSNLAEGKMRFGDIGAIVVVECTGANMLVGQALHDVG